MVNAIKKGSYNKTNRLLISKSKELQDLISQLLEINVSKRLSAEEALSHPFFTKIVPFPFQVSQLLGSNNNIIDSFFRNILPFKCKNKFIEMVLCFLCHNISMKNQEIEINVEATQAAIEAIEALTEKLLKQIEATENKGE